MGERQKEFERKTAALVEALRAGKIAEANLRPYVENLLNTFPGRGKCELVREEGLPKLGVRLDIGVTLDHSIIGAVELKESGKSLEQHRTSSHNKAQWENLKAFQNLIYTNGWEWELFHDEVDDKEERRATKTVSLRGEKTTGEMAKNLESLLNDFYLREPQPINSFTALLDRLSILTRMLKDTVYETSKKANNAWEEAGRDSSRIGKTYRDLLRVQNNWAELFPEDQKSPNLTFADGFAQAVVFSLIIGLMRIKSPAEPANKLKPQDTLSLVKTILYNKNRLLYEALDLFGKNIDVENSSKINLQFITIIRHLQKVDWDQVSRGSKKDLQLHLYEHFLADYDIGLRKSSGSYYTPTGLVDQMVRLADEALQISGMGSLGGAKIIDPAMGTGTFLLSIIQRVYDEAQAEGKGFADSQLKDLLDKLHGFERQLGPYAIASWLLAEKAAQLVGTDYKANEAVRNGLNLRVTDTLASPEGMDNPPNILGELAVHAKAASNDKSDEDIKLCIGNPPYKQTVKNSGAWVEKTLMKDWKLGRLDEEKLTNLYIFFWRWACWKIFEGSRSSIDSIDNHGAPCTGVICFVTPSAYIDGTSFEGMRRWLREHTDHGWIINLSPEGNQFTKAGKAGENIFRDEKIPVAIGIFANKTPGEKTGPSRIAYAEVSGTRKEKLKQLSKLRLSSSKKFKLVSAEPSAPFLPPVGDPLWNSLPPLIKLIMSEKSPAKNPGMTSNRNWVYAPSPEILQSRWKELVLCKNDGDKRKLFKETRDSTLQKHKLPLFGEDTVQPHHSHPGDIQTGNTDLLISGGSKLEAFANEKQTAPPTIIAAGWRGLDRQYLIPDSRLIDMPRPGLWECRGSAPPGYQQWFLIEQHSVPLAKLPAPAIVFSPLIPDLHFSNSNGGRAFPLFLPNGQANMNPKLIKLLKQGAVPADISEAELAEQFFCYLAGIAGHSGYQKKFREQLKLIGSLKVPLTTDNNLWNEVAQLGKLVLRITERCFKDSQVPFDRSLKGEVEAESADSIPWPIWEHSDSEHFWLEQIVYDEKTHVLRLVDGKSRGLRWEKVLPRVAEYRIGSEEIIKTWFKYRKHPPGGKETSSLDKIQWEAHDKNWPETWSREFHRLLNAVTALSALERKQKQLLEEVLSRGLILEEELS